MAIIYGAECPPCRLSLTEPCSSQVQAVIDLGRKHQAEAGSSGLDCRHSWELVKIETDPPVSEQRYLAFPHALSN